MSRGRSVTRRQHRAESRYFSREVVTVQGGYGALFAVQLQILLSITSVAPCPVRAERVTGVQAVSEPEICHGAGI